MLSAELVGMAKPIVAVLERKPWVCPAVMIPMTWPVELTSGPPDSPAAMSALISIIPVSCSVPSPALAVID